MHEGGVSGNGGGPMVGSDDVGKDVQLERVGGDEEGAAMPRTMRMPHTPTNREL